MTLISPLLLADEMSRREKLSRYRPVNSLAVKWEENQMERRFLSWALVVILLVALLGIQPQPTDAASFLVNSNWDGAGASDADLSDGICSDSYGWCTLRAAMEQANDWAGVDAITFATPMTITVDAGMGQLPVITDQVTIDASGEASAGRPGVTIDGDGGQFVGLQIGADGCEIYGLHITDFANGGMAIASDNNKIGSANPDQRNVISGNGNTGIEVTGSNNQIQNNWIGVGLDGQTAAPNVSTGILVSNADNNLIGGETAGTGNYISGNNGCGVLIMYSDANRLGDNVIGLAPVNDQPMGNTNAGVWIYEASNTEVGASPLRPNTIAHNGGRGVWVDGSTALGNQISQNSIYDNDGWGIVLSDGGNAELAAPVITAISPTSVSGTGCAGCTVHIYSDDHDEGEIYEGWTTADAGGYWYYSGSLAGPLITATNTDASNNTSQFSAPRTNLPSRAFLPLVQR